MTKIKIGTRGSALALVQTKIIADEIKKNWKEARIETVIIKTRGDKILDKPLSEIGGKGLFVEEFEDALLNEKIDLAVHSAKDLPEEQAEGLEIIAAPKRADACDVLISKTSPENLKAPVIGTSSIRRSFYAKKLYPDARIKSLRGNVETRLNKLQKGEYDAIILAKAGLDRLGINGENFDLTFLALDTKDFIPAPCQGIIVVQARKDYKYASKIKQITDELSFFNFKLERYVLNLLQAGCNDSAAVYSEFTGEKKVMLSVMFEEKQAFVTASAEDIYERAVLLVKEVKS